MDKDKVDIFHYNIFLNKPKYVYSVDKKRLKDHTYHYGKPI